MTKAQSTAFQALYQTFWGQEWFAGGFLWKWKVQQRLRQGKSDKSFSPQNKSTEEIIRRFYRQHTKQNNRTE